MGLNYPTYKIVDTIVGIKLLESYITVIYVQYKLKKMVFPRMFCFANAAKTFNSLESGWDSYYSSKA